MSNYVSDKAAAKSVSAYVILSPKGKRVATVKAHWGNSTCLVNVHDDLAGFQYARAGGYGYDKFTSALSGLTIDGHLMSDHCGERLFGLLPLARSHIFRGNRISRNSSDLTRS